MIEVLRRVCQRSHVYHATPLLFETLPYTSPRKIVAFAEAGRKKPLDGQLLLDNSCFVVLLTSGLHQFV